MQLARSLAYPPIGYVFAPTAYASGYGKYNARKTDDFSDKTPGLSHPYREARETAMFKIEFPFGTAVLQKNSAISL